MYYPAAGRRNGAHRYGGGNGAASRQNSNSSGNSSISSTMIENKLIKSGASGSAMLCTEQSSGDKIVKKHIKCKNRREVEHAKAEAAILEDLRSTNVIGFKDFEQTNPKEVNIYMDYADGGDLGDEIQRRTRKGKYYSESELLERFADCVKAVSTMHAKGIVHRDIKPENIFIDGERAKIGDFGIAKSCSKNGRVRTPVGTPLYLDPQRCEGRDYGQKADMWSLGCVLYEMAALRPAFNARSMGELKRKVLRCQVDYSKIPKHFNEEVTSIIKSLLEVREDRRHSISDVMKRPIIRETIHKRNLLKESQSSEGSTSSLATTPTPTIDDSSTNNLNKSMYDTGYMGRNQSNNNSSHGHKSGGDSPSIARRTSRRDLAPLKRIKTPENIRRDVRERNSRLGSYNRQRSNSPYQRQQQQQQQKEERLKNPMSPLGSSRKHQRKLDYNAMKSNLMFDRDSATPQSKKMLIGNSTSRALKQALNSLGDSSNKSFMLLPPI